MRGQRTTHPVVPAQWRPVVAALRDEGCEFIPRSSGKVLVMRGATNMGTIGGRRETSAKEINQAVARLQRAGLLADYGKPPAKVAASTPPTQEGNDGGITPAVHDGPALPHSGGPDERQPPADRQPPDEHPDRPGAGQGRGLEQAVAAVGGDPVLRRDQPVRPHTAHQYRVDDIRRRILRALQELGGAQDPQVRTEFVTEAVQLGRTAGYELREGVDGRGRDRAVMSLRESLRGLLQGTGASAKTLDVFELVLLQLEAPRPQARALPATGTEGRVAPIRYSGEPGSRPLYVSPRTDGQPVGVEPFASEVPPGFKGVAVNDVEGIAQGAVPEPGGLPSAAPPVPEGLLAELAAGPRAPAGTPLDSLQRQYIERLMDRAAEGDQDARDRLERYLGLG